VWQKHPPVFELTRKRQNASLPDFIRISGLTPMVNFVFAFGEPELPFVELYAHSPQSGYKWVMSNAY
jgi:hypothetical protein